jgi:polyhydroxyalkanoate synthesis regulator phasin
LLLPPPHLFTKLYLIRGLGKWGDRKIGKWGDREMGKFQLIPQHPNPNTQTPTPKTHLHLREGSFILGNKSDQFRIFAMANLGDLVKKAVYLGVGIATYAAEKAEVNLQELRNQAQKLADEMISRGEITTEEARKYVDDFVKQAQQQTVTANESNIPHEPRRIEIIEDEEDTKAADPKVDELRQKVERLQEELRKLQQD